MPFTYPWNTVNAAQTGADKPLDTTLMEAIRQNLIHLREWLGMSYYTGSAIDHNHNGANSAPLENGSVTLAKLALGSGSWVSPAGTTGVWYIAGNRYAHSKGVLFQNSSVPQEVDISDGRYRIGGSTEVAPSWYTRVNVVQMDTNSYCVVYWDYHT